MKAKKKVTYHVVCTEVQNITTFVLINIEFSRYINTKANKNHVKKKN